MLIYDDKFLTLICCFRIAEVTEDNEFTLSHEDSAGSVYVIKNKKESIQKGTLEQKENIIISPVGTPVENSDILHKIKLERSNAFIESENADESEEKLAVSKGQLEFHLEHFESEIEDAINDVDQVDPGEELIAKTEEEYQVKEKLLVTETPTKSLDVTDITFDKTNLVIENYGKFTGDCKEENPAELTQEIPNISETTSTEKDTTVGELLQISSKNTVDGKLKVKRFMESMMKEKIETESTDLPDMNQVCIDRKFFSQRNQ